jgi:membrane protease YdiL (CAAX protease family)
MIKVVAGAFAIAGLAVIMLTVLWVPVFRTWLMPLFEHIPGDAVRIGLLVLVFVFITFLPGMLPAWLMGRLCHGRLRLAMRYGGARLRDLLRWKTLFAGAAVCLAIYAVSFLVRWPLLHLGLRPDYLDSFSRYEPGSGILMKLFIVGAACFVAPVSEEIVYRGYLLEGIKGRTGFWPAAVLSSIVFSASHHYSVLQTILTFVFGLMLCGVMHRTGKLSVCIAAHFLWNLLFTLTVIF